MQNVSPFFCIICIYCAGFFSSIGTCSLSLPYCLVRAVLGGDIHPVSVVLSIFLDYTTGRLSKLKPLTHKVFYWHVFYLTLHGSPPHIPRSRFPCTFQKGRKGETSANSIYYNNILLLHPFPFEQEKTMSVSRVQLKHSFQQQEYTFNIVLLIHN